MTRKQLARITSFDVRAAGGKVPGVFSWPGAGICNEDMLATWTRGGLVADSAPPQPVAMGHERAFTWWISVLCGILVDAKKTSPDQLVGVPVEIVIGGPDGRGPVLSWRVLTEVL